MLESAVCWLRLNCVTFAVFAGTLVESLRAKIAAHENLLIACQVEEIIDFK